MKQIAIWLCVLLPTIALGGSDNAQVSISENIHISDIVIIVTLMAGLLTIITVVKSIFKPSEKGEDDEFVKLKTELKKEYTELGQKISELTKIDAATKIHYLEESVIDLDEKVNNYLMKKVYTLSEHFTMLENRVIDLDKYFEKMDADRRTENIQIKSDINTLRENIREDINDVKDIIMKLMMALKTDDD